MNPFEEYLALYEIDPLHLSAEAHVRYLIIHNAKKGNPITQENARKIKEAVLRLTGVPYTGSFVLIPAPVSEHLPVLPIKRPPSHIKQATPYAHRSCRNGTGS